MKTSNFHWAAALLAPVVILSGCAPPPDHGPTKDYAAASSVGRWCGKPSRLEATWQLIEIVEQPNLQVSIIYGDGSRRVRPVARRPAGSFGKRFEVVGDARGEVYEVAGTNNDLREVDQDGLIFIARRMEKTEPPSSCLPSPAK